MGIVRAVHFHENLKKFFFLNLDFVIIIFF